MLLCPRKDLGWVTANVLVAQKLENLDDLWSQYLVFEYLYVYWSIYNMYMQIYMPLYLERMCDFWLLFKNGRIRNEISS